jgi:hypothetical protein
MYSTLIAPATRMRLRSRFRASCAGWRMAGRAAHLVDCVVPRWPCVSRSSPFHTNCRDLRRRVRACCRCSRTSFGTRCDGGFGVGRKLKATRVPTSRPGPSPGVHRADSSLNVTRARFTERTATRDQTWVARNRNAYGRALGETPARSTFGRATSTAHEALRTTNSATEPSTNPRRAEAR